MSDEEDYNSEEDVDYVPSGKEAVRQELLLLVLVVVCSMGGA